MNTIFSLFFMVGYVLLVGPPRGATLARAERRQQGELSKQPIIVLVGVEYLIRASLLLVIFVGVEEVVGKRYYEVYQLDYIGMAFLGIGLVHTLAYYALLIALSSRYQRFGYKLYRLVRNLCYAPLPGIAAMIFTHYWQWTQKQPAFAEQLPQHIFLYTLAVFAVLGIAETLFASRKPLGLDELRAMATE